MGDPEQQQGWKSQIEALLGPTDSRLCQDFDNFSLIIAQLFKKVTNPPISVRNGKKVEVPANYTIKIGGSRRLYGILGDPDLFEQLPINLRKGILDIMSLLLSRGTTYVVRFQCHNTETSHSGSSSTRESNVSTEAGAGTSSLTRIFLDLLDTSAQKAENIDVSKRIVHLIGLTAAAGLSISDNRDVLALLHAPSELTISLLQALKNMTRHDNSIVKANPASFFNLGGHEAGITSGRMKFPFGNKEYQFFTWFRVEEFENTRLNWSAMDAGIGNHHGNRGLNYGQEAHLAHSYRTTQHIASILNIQGKGVDLFIQDKILHYYVSLGNGNDDHVVIKLDSSPLRRGVWYHVAVTHKKASRMNVFSKDELTIHLDHKVIYQENSQYPGDTSSQALAEMKFEVGVNFDGQICPVYFVQEAMDPRAVEILARADAGKPIDNRALRDADAEGEGGSSSSSSGGSSSSSGSAAAEMFESSSLFSSSSGGVQGSAGWDHSAKYLDLMDTLSVMGKKVSMTSKIATAYHPARCMYNHALDVQGGRHAKLGKRTQAWNIFNVRDILGSLGGISVILPILPRLLIDHNVGNSVVVDGSDGAADNVTSSNVGFGTSWGDVSAGDARSNYDLLDDAAKGELRTEMAEVEEDSCIALILEILTNLLMRHHLYQCEMLAISGAEMIEYAMTCVSNEVLGGEGERCVLALHGLCSAVQELGPLQTRFIRCLFLNLHIWWRSSFNMQSSLMYVLMSCLKREPAKYASLIDVHDLLDTMYDYYADVDEEELIFKPNEAAEEVEEATATHGTNFTRRLSVVRSKSLFVAGAEEAQEIARRARAETEDSIGISESNDDEDTDSVRARTKTEDFNRSRLMSAESESVHLNINYSISNQQRKSLRWSIQSIVATVIESSSEPLRCFQCLLDFIAVCKDLVILDEIAQMLLIFIVEGGGDKANAVIGSIIEACHGAEEFASFILRYIVHRPSENLRCTGVRIITHFYLRLGKVNPALSKLSLKNKRHGSNLVAMAVERLQALGRGSDNAGLQRLQVCGGMALLTEVITSHADSSTVNTYAVLLEMLLTKPGDINEVVILQKNVFDEKMAPHLGGSGSGINQDLSLTMKVSQFAAQYMHPDQFDESAESALNRVVLPVFLRLLPRLTLGSAQQQILSDLLSLLKHSESNRIAFCESLAWHTCMFEVVSRFVRVTPNHSNEKGVLRFNDVGSTLEKWARHTAWLMARAKNQPATDSKSGLLQRMEEQRKYAGALSQTSLLAAEAMQGGGSKEQGHEDEEDTWFAIGMKVYATLLLHALQKRNGWHEVSRTLSQSLENPAGRVTSYAVLSHFVNELTFIMQWRYRELQRLASSETDEEMEEALSYIDNIFSVMITVGSHALIGINATTVGLPAWRVAKLRVMYLKEVMEEKSRKRVESGAYDSDDSSSSEDHQDDEYLYEMAETMLVERATIRRRRDSLNTANAAAAAGKGGSDAIPHAEYSGADIGLGSTVISQDRNEKASAHPFLGGAQDYLDFSRHLWIDLGEEANVTPSGSGAGAALEAGRKRFTVSEFLHPLDRHQEIARGQLMLLLQNLRFWDVFFWPSNDLPLRNSPMMRFHKEQNRAFNEAETEEQKRSAPLSVCMSVLQQSFYVLHRLSPTNDLAELNVNRIHAIIESIDNVSTHATPTDDLLLSTLAQLTYSLQAVAQSLQPFYEMIGITEPVKVMNIGLSNVDDDDREDARIDAEEKVFDALYEDPKMCRLVEEYFDTPPAANLLHFVKSVALALVSLYDMRKDLFSEALDEFAFNCLESLVERVQFDLDFHVTQERKKVEERKKKRNSSISTGNVKFKPAGVTAPNPNDPPIPPRAGATSQQAAPPAVPHSSAIHRRASTGSSTGLAGADYSYNIGTAESLHGSAIHKGGNGGVYEDEDIPPPVDSVDTNSDGPVRRNSLGANRDSVTEYGDFFAVMPNRQKRSDSADSTDSPGKEGHYSRHTPKERSKGHSLKHVFDTGSRAQRSDSHHSRGDDSDNDTSRTSSVNLGDMAHAFDQQSHYHGTDSDAHFGGQIILKMVQWMRDLYFTCNLNRSVGLVKSLIQLEYHEASTARGYGLELATLSRGVSATDEFTSQSEVEEMSDLNNLSAFVAKRMATRHSSRSRTRLATDNLKLKSVAKKWNDNMRTFGAEWSPWYEAGADEGETAGVAQVELSKHKDRLMRRMVMSQLEHGVDHRDEAYFEGKERDQTMFEMGLDPSKDKFPVADGEEDGDAEKMTAPFTDILKNVQIKTAEAEHDKEWGDEDDEDEDNLADDSIMGQFSSSTVGTFFSDEQESTMMHDGEGGAPGASHSSPRSGGLANPLAMLSGTMSSRDARPDWALGYHWTSSEKCLLLMEASRVTLDKVMSGQLLLTNKYLYFHPRKLVGGLALAGKAKNSGLISFHDRRWKIESLSELYGRRYLLSNCAIELFFADGAEAFFAFQSLGELQKFFRVVKRQHTPLLRGVRSLNPRMIMKKSHYTEMWRKRQISNFEYLMMLNVVSGRSYNDITQYPVFPWVLADYTSDSLDLSGNKPGVFRDLSKPMGALNPTRLNEILERYRSFDEDTPEQMKFMYGSHYSSAGVVVHFLLRQEPYTSLAVNLQGGRFDCPDRLFFSIKNCWEGCTTSVSDVKELIPELYCCPEVFLNSNRLPLGELQDGEVPVDDVILPPWANGSPFEFVRLLREALESDYVSDHLHEWIDLIFGYKQQGEEAIKAHNLFYYITYENSVDIEAIDDPLRKEAAKAQVTHFGQTPSQLFKTPHEPRLPREECVVPLCSDKEALPRLTAYTPHKQLGHEGGHGAVLDVRYSGDKLVTVHADLSVCTYHWSGFPDGNGAPFELKNIRTRELACANQSMTENMLEKRSYVPFPDGSNDDTVEHATGLATGTGPGGGKGGNNNQSGSGSSRNGGKPSDMMRKFSRGLSMGFSFLKEAANTNTPGSAPSMSGVPENEQRGGGSSPSGPYLSNSEVDGVNLPPPPSAFDSSGNPLQPNELQDAASHSVTSPRRLSIGSSSSGNTPVKDGGNDSDSDSDSVDSGESDSFVPSTKSVRESMPLALSKTNHRYVSICFGPPGSASAGVGKVVSCCYWDQTVKVHSLDNSLKPLSSSKGGHVGAITCLHQGDDSCNGSIIVTGGEDGTCRVWIERTAPGSGSKAEEDDLAYIAYLSEANDSGANSNEMLCVKTLWGHTSPVTCLSYSADLDLVVSASSTGLLCLHSVRKGLFLRALHYLENRNVVDVLATSAGYLVASTADIKESADGGGKQLVTHEIHLFWVNGQHLKSMTTSSRVVATTVNGSKDILAVGGEDGTLTLLVLNSLEFMCEFDLSPHGSVSCIWFSDDRTFLMVGSQDGTFSVLCDPQQAFARAQNNIQKTAMLGGAL